MLPTPATPWTFAEESPAVSGDTSITLVQGSSFVICDRRGDIGGSEVDGLFVADTRILSTMVLRLDGARVEPLATTQPAPFAASSAGRSADEVLLVLRDLHVGQGLRVDLRLRNLSLTRRTVSVTFEVGADLAGLFEVKEGRALGKSAPVAVDGETMRIGEPDAPRGAILRVSKEATLAGTGVISWTARLAAKGEWSTCIEVGARRATDEITPLHRCGDARDDSAPAVRHASWQDDLPSVHTDVPALAEAVARACDDLGALRIFDPAFPDDPVVAAGAPWFMTLFGRDSLITAFMALALGPSLALSTVRILARLQGTKDDLVTEEQPGRILHEVRPGARPSLSFAEGTIYYGSVDATPLFVMLVAELRRWGTPIDELRPLLPHVDAALGWLAGPGDPDGDGYVEYDRPNDQGLVNQGWKDSWDGVSFADGRLAESPIALAEVQGYAYAAWLAGAALADAVGDHAVAEARRGRAGDLKERFNRDFWLAESASFAIALDRDKRAVDSVTSNMGHCLWTGIVDDDKAGSVAAWLTSPELFSGWGVRTLATSMARYNPLSYHNGSVWPHDTAICVAGLKRAGFSGAANTIASGLLAAAAASGGRLPELFAGLTTEELAVPVPYPASCSPQAWSSASPLLLVRSLLGLEPDVPDRVLKVDPDLPEGSSVLHLDGVPFADARLSILFEAGALAVRGLLPGFAVVHAAARS